MAVVRPSVWTRSGPRTARVGLAISAMGAATSLGGVAGACAAARAGMARPRPIETKTARIDHLSRNHTPGNPLRETWNEMDYGILSSRIAARLPEIHVRLMQRRHSLRRRKLTHLHW
jgi:hypothetical protein